MSFERLLNTFEDEESVTKAFKPTKYATEEKWRTDRISNNPEATDNRFPPTRKSYNQPFDDK